MKKMDTKAFENVKPQLSYCGIWCGSCVVGNGTLKDLTKRYDHVIRSHGVEKWGAEQQGFNGQEFVKALTLIQHIPLCPGCLKGGGATNCAIKACASTKTLSDCTECNEFMTCQNQQALHNVRTGAQKAGMMVKTQQDTADQQQLLKQWTAEIPKRFPHCFIFSDRCTN
jgi:hypothetical protein